MFSLPIWYIDDMQICTQIYSPAYMQAFIIIITLPSQSTPIYWDSRFFYIYKYIHLWLINIHIADVFKLLSVINNIHYLV